MVATATPIPAPLAQSANAAQPVQPAQRAASPGLALSRRLDRVYAAVDGAEPVPARVVWARPVTAPGGEVALLDDRKRCIAMVPALTFLDPASRAIAAEELDRRYCIARITRVVATRVDFGNRYWQVETDRGPRSFLLREPSKNVQRVAPDRVVIRDSLGNRYEIPAFAALDERSRVAAELAL